MGGLPKLPHILLESCSCKLSKLSPSMSSEHGVCLLLVTAAVRHNLCPYLEQAYCLALEGKKLSFCVFVACNCKLQLIVNLDSGMEVRKKRRDRKEGRRRQQLMTPAVGPVGKSKRRSGSCNKSA